MTRPVRNKLFDLEIDEISVVDRPANQHGLIAFAKSTGLGEVPDPQEDSMPDYEVYDSEGLAVDEDELEHGDVVYDEEGNEYVFVVEDDDDDEDGDVAYAEDYDEESVGKAGITPWIQGGAARLQGGRMAARSGIARTKQNALGFVAGAKRNRAASVPGAFGGTGYRAGSAAWGNRSNLQRAGIVAAPTLAAAGGAGTYGYQKTKKSLGDEVLEGLSKAVDDNERNQYIAKALDEIEVYKAQNEAMAEELDAMYEDRIEDVFISKAAEYNLPVSPEVLGPILKAMTEVLDDEQLDVVDALFASVGDALYDEIGYVGDTDNLSVIDQVDAYADELVGKSDLTAAQAQVLAFEANPAAYEAYLLENGR
jgi:hypothetical protein